MPGFVGGNAPVDKQESVAISQRHGAAVAGAPLEGRQLVIPAPPLSLLLVKFEPETV